MRKFLKSIFVIQEVKNSDREKPLGKGYTHARRLNPYNPLSYVLVVIVIIIGLFAYGIKGIWDQIDVDNPFKWN